MPLVILFLTQLSLQVTFDSTGSPDALLLRPMGIPGKDKIPGSRHSLSQVTAAEKL